MRRYRRRRPLLKWLALTALASLLAGCADRVIAPAVPLPTVSESVENVMVATNRGTNKRGFYTGKRAQGLAYLDLGISIPQNREKGEIVAPGAQPDPSRQFLIARQDSIAGERAFVSQLQRRLAALPSQQREIVLYVHGFNTSFSESVFRAAQLQHDFGLPGVPVVFSWPSDANPLDYAYDRDSALYARDDLESLLRSLHAAGGRRIVVIGHSMGGHLIMESLRQIDIRDPGWSRRALGGVVLISPDIDLSVFKKQAGRIAGLPQPFAVFVSKRDRVLALSARVSGASKRLGTQTDPETVAELPVTLVDVSAFETNGPLASHFAPGTSPALISLLLRSAELNRAFRFDRSGQAGLVSSTVITVQNATALILSPGLLLEN